MRLYHGVLPGKRQHHVAICADGLSHVAVKLQVVSIGPGPSGSIIYIALVVLCNQDLRGSRSFDFIGRALRTKTE